jgi:glycosyltransferase involved in cell wall biosynthesis
VNARIALFLPTLDGGGAERAFVELANQFASLGARVDLVLAHCQGPYVGEIHDSVRVIDFHTTRKIPALLLLVRYLVKERPDVLLSGLDVANAGAVIASFLAGARKRCVLSQRAVLRESWLQERPDLYPFWLPVFRFTYRRAGLIIANSHAVRSELIENLGISPSRCVVIHNPVDVHRVERLAREEVDHPWVAGDAPPLLISAGSLTVRKGMDTLLRAFAIVRTAHECNLLILGEGPERGRLEGLIREFGLEDHVQMPGFDPNPFRWMARARVLLSSSLAEGCPNVIQQALVCGTPVVATDCPGGTSEILEGGTWGRLVPVRDPQAMADAIVASLKEPCPPDGRIRAADFDPRSTAERYLSYLLPNRPLRNTVQDHPGPPEGKNEKRTS